MTTSAEIKSNLPTTENSTSKKIKLSKAHFLKWFKPLVQALKDLGGSAKLRDAIDKIVKNENVDQATLSELRGKTKVNKFENEIQWVKYYLSEAGIIDGSKRGIWALTEQGKKVDMTLELASLIFKKQWRVSGGSIEIETTPKTRHWIYSPGPDASEWESFYKDGIMGFGWDGLKSFEEYNSAEDISLEMQNLFDDTYTHSEKAFAAWQFANQMQIGDIIYSKKGPNTILGRGIVQSDYLYDETRDSYKSIRKVNWTHKKECPTPKILESKLISGKTLVDISQYTEIIDELDRLLLDEEEKRQEEKTLRAPYSDHDFLDKVYMNRDEYDTLVSLLTRKKNIILQGAPGVGKTFVAKKLAYSIMGEVDPSRVQLIQFHQSYSYEDFIMGYRPNGDGFERVNGAFYSFCKKVEAETKGGQDRPYFFIIDEINRGNLSKIFGELFMLIEHDKRSEENSVRLLYANEQFHISPNVHIIGMMNTADRSLALLDYALRRRFAFFEMRPAFTSAGFIKHLNSVNNLKFTKLIEAIKLLNADIEKDPSLGVNFLIGHSYFCDNSVAINDAWLNTVVRYEIIPLLQEYWFDENSKVEEWGKKLYEAIV